MQKTIWEKYAQVLVDYSTDVQKGDLVQIRAASIYAKDLVKAVYKRVLEKGAHPILRTSFEDFSDIFIKYASDEQLDYIDPIIKLEYEKIDKFISIGAPMNTKNMARADMKNLHAGQKPLKDCQNFLWTDQQKGKQNGLLQMFRPMLLLRKQKCLLTNIQNFYLNPAILIWMILLQN